MVTLVSPIPGAAFSSDGFGPRAPIDTDGDGDYDTGGFHYGQDIDVPAGTPICASAAGVVIASGWIGTYGYAVYIDHGGGIVTRYAHMLEQPPVGRGWHVNQGDRIGFVGSTGASTGAHLHWEVHVDGVAVDPLKYLSTSAAKPARKRRRKSMATLYYRNDTKPVTYALAGDSPGTSANWLETQVESFATRLAETHGNAKELSPATWEAWKARYLEPLRIVPVESRPK